MSPWTAPPAAKASELTGVELPAPSAEQVTEIRAAAVEYVVERGNPYAGEPPLTPEEQVFRDALTPEGSGQHARLPKRFRDWAASVRRKWEERNPEWVAECRRVQKLGGLCAMRKTTTRA